MGTSLCDVDCRYGCGRVGKLDSAMFFDVVDQACQSEVQHIESAAPGG